MRRFALLVVGLALVAGVAATVSGGATQAQPRWVATSLGTLGGKEGQADAINNKGQIVGSAEVRVGVQHAFLWQKGRMVDLGTFGGAESSAADINERSQVVGGADTKARDAQGEPIGHGFVWQNGHRTDLGAFSPNAINDRGQIAGWFGTEPSLWQNGKVTDLGGLPGASSCFPDDINERSQIVGVCFADEMSHLHAVLWQGYTARDLGNLGSAGATDIVIAINERGQIVGARNGRAFVWEKGKYRYLPTPPGKRTQAGDINEQGQVAGWLLGTSTRAVVWQNGRMTLLPNLPGTEASYAVAINERGQVVGWSFEGAGERHAVLWTLKSG
jgi:probable HAF family extracellular repeat protein